MTSMLWLNVEQWEIIYYVAFILLTIGIAFFSAKSYFFQSRKESCIFCKCLETARSNQASNLDLEFFNYGNSLVTEIKVTIGGKNFGIVPFMKPNESYFIPVGFFIYAGSEKILMQYDNEIKIDADKAINVDITYNDIIKRFHIDISMLYTSDTHLESESALLGKIAETLSKMERSQEKSIVELERIADAIKHKK